MPKNFRIKNVASGVFIAMLILAGVYISYTKAMNSKILSFKVRQIEQDSGIRIRNKVENANLNFPPSKLILSADKTKRTLTVYGCDKKNKPVEITSYRFTGYSGRLGPKLREGDGQIPEGVYDITALNPQSSFYLSIRVEYPNDFDKRIAASEGRTNLGGDIYIHGGSATIGCIPIGNDNIEELFYLVEQTGLKNTGIVITPHDLTNVDIDKQQYQLPWQKELYKDIKEFTRKNLLKDY
ncbi:MAG: L,D-transpeptidase family protein [Phycisphaerae bacterium]|nr:L,D-transpeptidase family protein [Phycisphaerae bacterium]